MTIQEALKKYNNIEIDLLLSHILGKSREFLFMNGEHKLTRIQKNELARMARRRMAGEPIAYIIGFKNFYGLGFKVTKDVLIPRQETEEIVEKVIRDVVQARGLRNKKQGKALHYSSKIKILDIGTGSGAIAVSIEKGLRAKVLGLSMTASDVSKKALKIAKFNAKKHKAKIKFIQSNLLKNIRFNPDIIIANLPYVDVRYKIEDLRYEPASAIYAEEKGLEIIGRLLKQIAASKFKHKLIYLEFDPRQKQKLSALIKKHLPLSVSKFYKDFAGRWRYVEIKK